MKCLLQGEVELSKTSGFIFLVLSVIANPFPMYRFQIFFSFMNVNILEVYPRNFVSLNALLAIKWKGVYVIL